MVALDGDDETKRSFEHNQPLDEHVATEKQMANEACSLSYRQRKKRGSYGTERWCTWLDHASSAIHKRDETTEERSRLPRKTADGVGDDHNRDTYGVG